MLKFRYKYKITYFIVIKFRTLIFFNVYVYTQKKIWGDNMETEGANHTLQPPSPPLIIKAFGLWL